MRAPPNTRPRRNWLLITFRRWHSWGGLLLSLFILVVAGTGILLNHKDVFFHHGASAGPTGALTTTADLASLPVSFDRALELARGHYGPVPLDKLELKDEHGRLVYKVSRGHGEEIRIDARTGEVFSKYGASLSSNGHAAPHWPKIVADVHTGKMFGVAGKLMVDLTAGVIIALSLTGIYLWAAPLLRRR